MPRLIFLNIIFLFVAGVLFARADIFQIEMDQMMTEVFIGVGMLTLACIIGGGVAVWFFDPDEGIIIPTISIAHLSFASSIFWLWIIRDSRFNVLPALLLIPLLCVLIFMATKAATSLQTIAYKTRWSVIPFAVTTLAFGLPFQLPAFKWVPCCIGITLLVIYRVCIRYVEYENIGSYSASSIGLSSDDQGPSALDYMSSRGR